MNMLYFYCCCVEYKYLEFYHLISQDAINAILIQRNHPVQASDLIISQSSILNICQ